MWEDRAIAFYELGIRGECVSRKFFGREEEVVVWFPGDRTERLWANALHLGDGAAELFSNMSEFVRGHGIDDFVQRDPRALFHTDIPDTGGLISISAFDVSSMKWGVMKDFGYRKGEAPSVEHCTNFLRKFTPVLNQHTRRWLNDYSEGAFVYSVCEQKSI